MGKTTPKSPYRNDWDDPDDFLKRYEDEARDVTGDENAKFLGEDKESGRVVVKTDNHTVYQSTLDCFTPFTEDVVPDENEE